MVDAVEFMSELSVPISPPETRASLILRLQDAADVAAWDEFVAIYAPVVYRSARRLGLQACDADDCVQEVLAAVARSVAKWLRRDDRGTFRTWLLRIARNTAIDFLTRCKHRPWAEGGNERAGELDKLEARLDVSSHFNLEYRREIFAYTIEYGETVIAIRQADGHTMGLKKTDQGWLVSDPYRGTKK